MFKLLDHYLIKMIIMILLPDKCYGFDWGDFHKIAVVFGTILGFGLGFFAICLVLYIVCMKPFFENFKEEVSETHRTWHPWPIGSVRWQLQQLIKSNRSDIKTYFPSTPITNQKTQNTQYLNITPLQNTLVQPAPYIYNSMSNHLPIIKSTDPIQTQRYIFQEHYNRPTYFTPSPEKPIFEEYTITREESFTSRGKNDNENKESTTMSTSAQNDQTVVIRTTTTRHSQRSLNNAPGSTFI